MPFSLHLLRWFALHGRELPWRDTNDPYRIWVSEVILQQTRVVQGIDYYIRFIDRFPTVGALAAAPLDDVMKVWQGLGYYTRASNLHAGAQQVVAQHGGELPRTYDKLLKIKGLGAYSAAAVASFAFGEAVPAIDGNVYRILARVFGVFTPTDSAQGRKEFFGLASELMDRQHPAAFNQAIIDFGALVCTFRQPQCGECPMAERCYALRNNMIGKLPVKGKRAAVRDRYFYYLMVRHGGHTFVRRRQERDIWHSLYEFPLIELPAPLPVEELMLSPDWAELIGDGHFSVLSVSEGIRHQLTHINIHARFIIVEVERAGYKLRADYRRVPIDELERYSVPRLIDAYMAAEPSLRYFRRK
ncbi:MAG: A/G-specific adenine glycosylase [Bacteroidales bacterium]|nr:A/G-specific adenine glycosylase [Bacteroidales bacterium]